MTCSCLPDLVECPSFERFDDYYGFIYEIFKSDFIINHPLLEGKPINIRKEPKEDGFENAFVHVTTCEYNKGDGRKPDIRRCERIRWIKAFIQHPNWQCAVECIGLKIWEEPYKNNTRVYILCEVERYLVVIEKRATYNLLITAYYLDYDNTLEKQLKRYERYRMKKQEAP